MYLWMSFDSEWFYPLHYIFASTTNSIYVLK